jgi:hypothetical protein
MRPSNQLQIHSNKLERPVPSTEALDQQTRIPIRNESVQVKQQKMIKPEPDRLRSNLKLVVTMSQWLCVRTY